MKYNKPFKAGDKVFGFAKESASGRFFFGSIRKDHNNGLGDSTFIEVYVRFGLPVERAVINLNLWDLYHVEQLTSKEAEETNSLVQDLIGLVRQLGGFPNSGR